MNKQDEFIKYAAETIVRNHSPFLFAFFKICNNISDNIKIKKQQAEKEKQQKYNAVSISLRYFNFTENPTKSELKQKYKQLAKIHHPDKESGSEQSMKELNHHYDALMKFYKYY